MINRRALLKGLTYPDEGLDFWLSGPIYYFVLHIDLG